MENNGSRLLDNIDAIEISKFFLSKRSLTPKKIQKLVYYAYAWFIALNNQSSDKIENILFEETPEAWIHEPVFPSLYREYKSYNWNEVPQVQEPNFNNEDLKSFLNDVWNTFGKFSADQLEYMTHQELPWINARNNVGGTEPSNNIISKKDIFTYYNSLIDV